MKDEDIVRTCRMTILDFDGDIFFLCNEPIVISSKIDKNIILDIEDKVTAKPKKYDKENIVEYEVMTRDNRIGEITNCATSIENKHTTNEEVKKVHEDYSSLLRILQGKEIDFLKTGTRWQMNNGLRRHLKQLPYFLLYNYPQKLKTYNGIKERNKKIENKEDKIKSNAYHSPSPMNELCDYICTWEKKNILWDNDLKDLMDTRVLIVNNDLDLTDNNISKVVRRYINKYADELKAHVNIKDNNQNSGDDKDYRFTMDEIINKFKADLMEELCINDEELVANYVIKTSYKSFSMSKSFAWAAYADYIIKNLRNNSNPRRNISIEEVPYMTNGSYEYLGKFYEFKAVNEYR